MSIVLFLATPENRNFLVKSIKSIFDHPAALVFYVEEKAKFPSICQSESVEAKDHYQKVLQELKELLLGVCAYMDAVENHPTFDEMQMKAILAELNDKNEHAVLEIEDRERFPRISGFLQELEVWTNDVIEHFDEVEHLVSSFETEYKSALSKEKEFKELKNITISGGRIAGGTIGAVGAGAVGAATAITVLTGGVGGLLIAGAAAAAGAGVVGGYLGSKVGAHVGTSAASDFSKQESGFAKLQPDLEKLKTKADDLHDEAKEIKRFKEQRAVLRTSMKTIRCEQKPLLVNLPKTFKKIFEQMNTPLNLHKAKQVIKQQQDKIKQDQDKIKQDQDKIKQDQDK